MGSGFIHALGISQCRICIFVDTPGGGVLQADFTQSFRGMDFKYSRGIGSGYFEFKV